LKSTRLDILLIEKGFFPSRETARTAIMDGAILVNGEKQTKPGQPVSADARVELIPSYAKNKFASRGGLKLESALEQFRIDPSNRICLDIGASTGGFTDCLLKAGATKVYAVDVGYGQLLWQLRQDPRVVCIERFNARKLTPALLYKEDEPWANLAVIDVSFIALDKVLKPCFDSLDAKTGEAVCLVKPQFEVGREKVGKGGVVRNPEDHISVLENVLDLANRLHLSVKGIHHSPIKGPAGNIEFLIHLSRKIENENTGDQIERIDGIKRIDIESIQIDVQTIVVNAHKLLNVD
jgi:23S rRNA (cytidine1920-2'-O)/16S rRNA (cytidine1409-2'-O)-methyltransferase